MATAPAGPIKSTTIPAVATSARRWKTRAVVVWSSFFFATLQSICTGFAMLGALHLVLGVGSLAALTQFASRLDVFHANSVRLPMLSLALAGSILSLIAVERVRRLRNRPASQWRRRALTAREQLLERTQVFVAVTTLVLIAAEETIHLSTFHHL